MNIVFFGSGTFALRPLEYLYKSKHKIIGVVTAPDAKKGRGLKKISSELKNYSLSLGLDILQPKYPNERFFIEILKALSADLFVVASYGKILSSELIALPKKFSINIHPSLLPRYRGAAPMKWAILNGEKETGVSIIRLNEQMDAGDIIAQNTVMISPEDDIISLSEKLSHKGISLLIDIADIIESGNIDFIPQDERFATYAPLLKKSDGLIKWDRSAQEIHDKTRALLDWPCAHTYLNGALLKIFKTKVSDKSEKAGCVPGCLAAILKESILVQTGKGYIEIYELQLEGSKRMRTREFLLGHRLKEGEILGQ